MAKPRPRRYCAAVNPALRSFGLTTIVFGAAMFAFTFESGHRPGVMTIAVCVALVAGGVGLLLKQPWSFWLGLGAGAFTFVAGLVSLKLGRAGGFGAQPILPIVVGLYVCLRVALAKNALVPRKRRGLDDDGDDRREAE